MIPFNKQKLKGLFLLTGVEKNIYPACEQSIIILSGVWVKTPSDLLFDHGQASVNLTNTCHPRDILTKTIID
jgi:hypothetical protein